MVKELSITLAAGLCAAGIVVSASAQPTPPPTVTNIGVGYDDLNLESEPGVRAMLARLDAAATKACGRKPVAVMPGDAVGLAKEREFRRCKTAAMDSSTARLGSPLVRAAWRERQAPSAVRRQDPVGVAQADTGRSGSERSE